MKKNFWQLAKVAPALVGASLLAASPAQAGEELNGDAQIIDQVNSYSEEGFVSAQDQVTSVSQLRDVSPTDWAYEALRSLVERYGCIVGYPDTTFRGNRALSRYEFAAGLNACMQQMERLFAASEAVLREDIAKLQRLMKEFEAELAALGARVDNLEGRVAFLEDHQFSTTTKLQGEAILALTAASENDDNQAILANRVRLALNTSFTGEDLLVTRLASSSSSISNKDNLFKSDGEGTNFEAPTLNQTFQIGSGNNSVDIDWIGYYSKLNFFNAELKFYVAGTGGIQSDYANTNRPFFEDFDGGNGALSTFASENPIFRIGGGVGGGLTYEKQDWLKGTSFTVGYLAPDGADPSQGRGLFNGNYGLLAQVYSNVTDNIGLSFTYVHGYSNGEDDTGLFNDLVGTDAANLNGRKGNANAFGFDASWRVSERVSLVGFFTYVDVDGKGGFRDDDIYTYGGGVALPDLGKEGNLLGIFAGVQPYSDNIDDLPNTGLPVSVEAFYKYQLTDNISITPGVIWVTNPEQFDEDSDTVIGTVRTTFTF
jgi:hypothetical protein